MYDATRQAHRFVSRLPTRPVDFPCGSPESIINALLEGPVRDYERLSQRVCDVEDELDRVGNLLRSAVDHADHLSYVLQRIAKKLGMPTPLPEFFSEDEIDSLLALIIPRLQPAADTST